jgi:hypothetical protein
LPNLVSAIVSLRLKAPSPVSVPPFLRFYSSQAKHILYSRFACANAAFIASYFGILIEQNKE